MGVVRDLCDFGGEDASISVTFGLPCARDVCARDVSARDVYARDVCAHYVCARDVCARVNV